MPSERRTLEENINDSKNTRMNLAESMDKFDLRKDEFMHLGRYFKARGKSLWNKHCFFYNCNCPTVSSGILQKCTVYL